MKRLACLAFTALFLSGSVWANENKWNIDPIHSSLDFTIDHMMISKVHGSFKKVVGSVDYDGKDLKNASLASSIDISSVDTHDNDRDKHLLSPEFFDVQKYPEMTFVSKKIKSDSNKHFEIIGDLTMHGVTKEVHLTCDGPSKIINDPWGNKRFGVQATGKVNRKDFGMTFNKALDQGQVMVGDEVEISINAEMVQKKSAS